MAKRAAPLDPYTRSTLRGVLQPPPGYELAQALGTAYSLDAETLITIPLFAAGLGAEDGGKPLGIAKVFEIGERMTLLVQGDRIAMPARFAKSKDLIRLVGDAVVPCSVPGGSFHPKLLVLEFAGTDRPEAKFSRVVISTRNLTTDNSWDSVVVLDEIAGGQSIAGLSEAVGALAKYINDKQHPAVKKCGQVANRLSGLKFHAPPGFESIELQLFEPESDRAKYVQQLIAGDELLVISPFVKHTFLQELKGQAGKDRANRWLVTRPVDVPPSAFKNFQVFKLADGAQSAHSSTAGEVVESLAGLHAKIYMATQRRQGTRVVITSANATVSGWKCNVEVAFTGRLRSPSFSVSRLMRASKPAELGTENERSFRDLLDQLESSEARSEPDPHWEKVVRSCLASASVVGAVVKGPPRKLGILAAFKIHANWPASVEVSIYPFGHPALVVGATLTSGGLIASFEVDRGIELVPFVVMSMRKAGERPLELVLAMTLEGDIGWSRESARASLARAARPQLYQELLWHFGVAGGRRKPGKGNKPANQGAGHAPDEKILPILEKVLLRVHGSSSTKEIATLDVLLSGLEDDDEFAPLVALWKRIKASL